MHSKETALIIFACFAISVSGTPEQNEVLYRNKRQLLFPNSTLLQFNAGIGTPSPAEKINVNWAFQANFQLPWNRSQVPVDVLEANSGYLDYERRKRRVEGGYESDAKLHHFYQFVDEVFKSFGHGSQCVQQALCRVAEEPLHTTHQDDLLHDLASFVLNPTNDIELGLKPTDEEYRYIEAYKRGEQGKECLELYSDCSRSLVDMFSVLES